MADLSYKTHNTPASLAQLTDFELKSAGVSEKDVRKLVLSALKKAGYSGKPQGTSAKSAAPRSSELGAGPSTPRSKVSAWNKFVLPLRVNAPRACSERRKTQKRR